MNRTKESVFDRRKLRQKEVKLREYR